MTQVRTACIQKFLEIEPVSCTMFTAVTIPLIVASARMPPRIDFTADKEGIGPEPHPELARIRARPAVKGAAA